MRFDGSNDILSTSAFANPSQISAIKVAKADAWTSPTLVYRPIATHGHGTSSFDTIGIAMGYLPFATAADWVSGDVISWGSGFSTTSNPRAIGPTTSGSDFRIVTTVFWTSLARVYVNGVRASTRKEATGTIATFNKTFAIGGTPGTSDVWSGDIGAIIYYTSNIGDPMRVRIERAQAYSFKIACS